MTWFSGEYAKLKQYTADQHGFLLRKQQSSWHGPDLFKKISNSMKDLKNEENTKHY